MCEHVCDDDKKTVKYLMILRDKDGWECLSKLS